MNVRVLIHGIVRQTTVLIAQLATAGGVRAPLAELANQIFLDLTRELEAQGVSRKVSADMFGMALRAYQKKIQRLSESSTVSGRSLWEAVMEYLETKQVVSRADVLRRFRNDEEALVRGVLHDLVESGLVSSTGVGGNAVFRVTSLEERAALEKNGEGLEEFLWLLVYREGPFTQEALAKRAGVEVAELTEPMTRLERAQRLTFAAGQWSAQSFTLPIGADLGWEAAMFDHYQSLVKTLCARLATLGKATALADETGGSTYTFVVWPGHPLEPEARALLRQTREKLAELRARINTHNAQHPTPENYGAVSFYFGQCVTEESADVNKAP